MIKKYDEIWDFDEETGNFVMNQAKIHHMELTQQYLADMISFAHAQKVLKDNEIKRIYSRGTEEPR